MTKQAYAKLASWMAIFAILFAYFAPAVSQAMPTDNHSNVIYQKVCSEHVTKVIPVKLPSGTYHDDGTSETGHCPLCLTQIDAQPMADSEEFRFRLNKAAALDHTEHYQAPEVRSHISSLSNSPQAPPSI